MKKIVGMVLALALLLCITSPNVYAISPEAVISGDATVSLPLSEQIRKGKIESLLDERVYFQIEHPEDTIGLCEIDDQLQSLGVDFLDDQEVQQLLQDEVAEQIAPYASVPSTSPNNTWMTYITSIYSYNGKKYNIRTVVVNPKNYKSKLANEATVTIEYPDQSIFNLTAASLSLLKTAAGTIGGEVSPAVPIMISYVEKTPNYPGYPSILPSIYGYISGKQVKTYASTYDVYPPYNKTHKDLSIRLLTPNYMLDCE